MVKAHESAEGGADRAGEIPAPTVKVRTGEDQEKIRLSQRDGGPDCVQGLFFYLWHTGTMQRDTRVYLRRALQLAEKGRGWVSPNPLVGAVIVRDGQIVGEGYHAEFGGAHAEIVALRQAGDRARDSTLYVTLEPCCHYGKTPPCTDAIIRAGVRKVVVAGIDPNPLVNGKGLAALRRAGIEVEVVDTMPRAQRLNRGYFHWIRTGLPFVTLKAAITLDGKIATVTGSSKWITSEPARRLAHRLRAEHDAILVGRGTLAKDDPELTVRHVSGPNPIRILLDEDLGAVGASRAAQVGRADGKTLVLTAADPKLNAAAQELERAGIRVERVALREDGLLDMREAFGLLGRRGITSILVEGGSRVFTSLLCDGLVNELAIFLAPKICGTGLSLAGDLGIEEMDEAMRFVLQEVRRVGPDLFLRLVPAEAKE